MDADKRQDIALCLYQVTAPIVTQNLNRVQYGKPLQEVTRQEYSFGGRSEIWIGRRTIQRWVRDYRRDGPHGLEPAVRSDKHVRRVVAPAISVLNSGDGKHRFMAKVGDLPKMFAPSVPRPETEMVRDHLVYFRAVRAAIRKR